MGGIDNDVVYGTNFDFSGSANVSATMTADGELLIGNSAGQPQVNTLTSTGGTITITNGNGTINLDTAGGMALATLTGNAGGAVSRDGANNIDLLGTATNGINITGTPASNLLTIAMQSPYADGDFTFTESAAGSARTLTVSQTDNTNTASNAILDIVTGGASGGDPFVHVEITGIDEYSFGMDNTGSDYLKLTNSSSPSGGSEVFIVNGTQSINFTTQIVDHQYSTGGVGNVYNEVWNTSTAAAASNSFQYIAAESTSTGDPFVQFSCHTTGTASSATQIGFGCDNSDADSVKMTYSTGTADPGITTPSAGTVLYKMTVSGERTIPLQPAFLSRQTNSVTDVTGNGTIYTVLFANEVFDQNADFNPATGTFQAPVTGKYHLSTTITMSEAATATSANIMIETSNRSVSRFVDPSKIFLTGATDFSFNIDVLIDMDATDTAVVKVKANGIGADTADITGNNGGGDAFGGSYQTFFSGHLAC